MDAVYRDGSRYRSIGSRTARAFVGHPRGVWLFRILPIQVVASSMKFRHRKDTTHQPIVDALEAAGWLTKNCAQLDGWVDVTALSPRKRLFLLELKTGPGKLRESQSKLIADGWPVLVIRSVDEALALIQVEARTR